MGQLSFSFSRAELELLGGVEFRAATSDEALVDFVAFEIGQADNGGAYTPIQFGARLPAIIDALQRIADRGGVDEHNAQLAGSLARKLSNQP